jgi:hypothetical protein
MTFFYKVLEELPAPPAEIIAGVDRNLRPTQMEIGIYHERELKNWYGKNFTASRNVRIKYPAFYDWVKANLTDRITDAGINYVNIKPTSDPVSTGAHTDITRCYVLMWEIESGGPDSKTVWWRRRGQDIWCAPEEQAEDFSELEFLDEIKLPAGRWSIINTQALHSVEYLTDTRIFLQVSLLNDLAVKSIKGIRNDLFV